MDSAQFTIELIDRVSAPSRKAAASIDRINKKLKESHGRMGALSSYQFKNLVKAKAFDQVGKGASYVAGKMATFAKWAAIGGAAIAGTAAVMVTKGVVSMGIFADASRRAFASITGSAGAGEDAFKRSVALADLLGADVEEITGQFKQLLAMQFSIGEAEDLIKISADLQLVTGSAEQATRAIRAITQIKAKGRLQAEELVGQLSEAGVSASLVYDALGKKFGKSTDEVRKMITAGKVDAKTGIDAIKAAIMKMTNETAPGEAAVKFGNETLTGIMGTLKTMPKQIFLRISDAMTADFESLKGTLLEIIEAMKSIDAEKVAEFVRNVLEMAKQLIPLAKEFAAGFGEGFSEILAGMRELSAGGGLASQLETAREAGKGIAAILAFVLWVTRVIAKVVSVLASPFGKIAAVVGIIGVLFLKFLLLLGSATQAIVGVTSGVGTLAAGWATFISGLGVAWGWIVALGAALKTVGILVLYAVTWIATIPAVIVGAIAAAAAAVIATIWVFREEIAKFMLWLWDASVKAGKDLVLGLISGITSMLSALWDVIKKAGTAIWDVLSGKKSVSELGLVGSTDAALRAAGVKSPALTRAQPTAAPLAQPELSETVASAPRDQSFQANMTIHVDGAMSAEQARETGQGIGSAASDTMNERFFGDMALQSGA